MAKNCILEVGVANEQHTVACGSQKTAIKIGEKSVLFYGLFTVIFCIFIY